MAKADSFEDLMARLRTGDTEAAAGVHRRFVRRLDGLAWNRFDAAIRTRADHEGAVQSAFRSFFSRYGRGEFDPEDWDALWHLLALITVRKCNRRRGALRALRRGA